MGFLHHNHHEPGHSHDEPAPAPTSPQPVPDSTADPTILLTFDGWMVGRLGERQRRVSDTLAASSVVELETDGGPVQIDRDEILIVVPPPYVSDPSSRLARRRCPVAVDVGAATVRGDCHVIPGTTPWDTWQRSTSGFAAVTDAVLDFPDGTSETADVVLISRYAARSGLIDR